MYFLMPSVITWTENVRRAIRGDKIYLSLVFDVMTSSFYQLLIANIFHPEIPTVAEKNKIKIHLKFHLYVRNL